MGKKPDRLARLRNDQPECDWDWNTSKDSLLGSVELAGCRCHLLAVRIRPGLGGVLVAIDEDQQTALERLAELVGIEETPRSVELPHMPGEWVIWAEPYAV